MWSRLDRDAHQSSRVEGEHSLPYGWECADRRRKWIAPLRPRHITWMPRVGSEVSGCVCHCSPDCICAPYVMRTFVICSLPSFLSLFPLCRKISGREIPITVVCKYTLKHCFSFSPSIEAKFITQNTQRREWAQQKRGKEREEEGLLHLKAELP